jgi:subtilisin family serine protease
MKSMTAGRTSGHYVVFEADGELAGLHKTAADKLREASEGYLRVGLSGLPDNVTARVRSHPSEDWELVLHHSGHRHGHVSEKVCAVELAIASGRRISHDDVGGIRACLRESLKDYQELGSDLPISLAEYWSPSEAIDPLFGNRRDARRLLGADYLRQQEGASGKGVNVVVVDQGVDKELVGRLGGNFGGGWTKPGMAQPGATKGGHGAMLVSNVLSIAPKATIFDCPAVPEEIANIRRFLSHAHAAYSHMLAGIAHLRELDPGKWSGPWILLNAWATFSRGTEHPAGDYTNNPDHPFNRMIDRTVDSGVDVIFAAGNCGQFQSSRRCGSCDQGPGHSILGANSHPKVLSVGAVRVDGLWLGYSSQGPGQPKLARHKPDLCAPSQFREMDDSYTSNTGTSAASALAAGVVAALRTTCHTSALPPDELKMLLIKTARRTQGTKWNRQLGNGILDAAAAFDEAASRKS